MGKYLAVHEVVYRFGNKGVFLIGLSQQGGPIDHGPAGRGDAVRRMEVVEALVGDAGWEHGRVTGHLGKMDNGSRGREILVSGKIGLVEDIVPEWVGVVASKPRERH